MHSSRLFLQRLQWFAGLGAATLLVACGGGGLPQLSAANPGTLQTCADLAAKAAFANTTITAVSTVPAGGLTATGIATPIPEHCLVRGEMNARTGALDNRAYAIGFEMRLPVNWNGRFLHQGNGGLDGSVVTAAGGIGGGSPVTNGLSMGFAVLSSNAGNPAPSPFFGIDPIARSNYGYQAVGTLTPMAKNLVRAAYGRAPDRSYFAGCSNGGRHGMVTAARWADDYDGILAGNPGFHLPKAAHAQLWKVQQWASIATIGTNTLPDISTAVTPAEFQAISRAIVSKCDTLDGVADNAVADVKACQAVFNLATDVPTCTGARDGSCLSAAQKTVLQRVFAGPRKADGTATYVGTWWDPGVAGSNFALWNFTNSQNLDPGAVAFIFSTPPTTVAAFTAKSGLEHALAYNIETDYDRIFATNATYVESSWAFMTPPNETNLSRLKDRGAKLMVYHGTADGVFSTKDTAEWYDALQTANGGDASAFARLYLVPGMNHCSGGPATDQFNMLQSLVDWVERGTAPDRVIAKARGAGANVVNTELPASWSAARTRPLCAYPRVARYNGSGDIEAADNFSCR